MAWWEIVLAVVGGLGGAGGVVGGLAGYLAKKNLQRDRERFERDMEEFRQRGAAAIEEIRTSGTKDIFVHRMQFENEFNIYLQMTNYLIALRRAFNNLLPLQLGPAPDPDTTMKELVEANGALNDLVYPRRPFYDTEVFRAANEMLKTVGKEVAGMRREARREGGGGYVSDEGAEKLKALMEVVFDRIRARVWSKEFMGYTHPQPREGTPDA
jgi:hypothetical protein